MTYWLSLTFIGGNILFATSLLIGALFIDDAPARSGVALALILVTYIALGIIALIQAL